MSLKLMEIFVDYVTASKNCDSGDILLIFFLSEKLYFFLFLCLIQSDHFYLEIHFISCLFSINFCEIGCKW